MIITVDLNTTRSELRANFKLWKLDPSEWEIIWHEDAGRKLPGVTVRYLRQGKWQEIICTNFPQRSQNLRQVFFLIQRLRIAEQQGLQYLGLAYSQEVATAANGGESQRKQDLLEAYDIIGTGPDDTMPLIDDIYKKKSMYYHPDKGGDPEKFKRLTAAYEVIKKSRGG